VRSSFGSERRKKLVLAVIDGLTPEALEHGIEERRLPALAYLAENGSYRRGVSVFPSVTPVCLSAIATGAASDVHGIPHLVWYHRGERRIVEYGSSFGAARAAGVRATLRDSVVEMSRSHLSPTATTIFESLEDAGLVTGAVNFTCYRGRHEHRVRLPAVASRNRWYATVGGPARFFFFNLYESDEVGTPFSVRSRTAGSVDAYAVAVGRWLVTRDGFDFLVYYLPDYDYASHAVGPGATGRALERADRALAELLGAAGGFEAFLERYAIIVCSDHGQTEIRETTRLEDAFADLRLLTPGRRERADAQAVVTASNRAGMVYRLGSSAPDARSLARRAEAAPGVDLVGFREADRAVVRRGGEELRFAPGGDGWLEEGARGLLGDCPRGLERLWHALACEAGGDVYVAAAGGAELVDLGGRHHLGGGSHGSLIAGDSLVPMLFVGIDTAGLPGLPSITDLSPLVRRHFGVPANGDAASGAADG
jgi:hypothetical protein